LLEREGRHSCAIDKKEMAADCEKKKTLSSGTQGSEGDRVKWPVKTFDSARKSGTKRFDQDFCAADRSEDQKGRSLLKMSGAAWGRRVDEPRGSHLRRREGTKTFKGRETALLLLKGLGSGRMMEKVVPYRKKGERDQARARKKEGVSCSKRTIPNTEGKWRVNKVRKGGNS